MLRSDEIAIEIVKSRDYFILTREQFDQFRVSKECSFLIEKYKETGRMTANVSQSSTTATKQDDLIKDFKRESKEIQVFLLHSKMTGNGINRIGQLQLIVMHNCLVKY